MKGEENVHKLSLTCPNETIYKLTMKTVIDLNLDERDYIENGPSPVNSWPFQKT